MRNDIYTIKFLNGRNPITIPPLDENNETCLTLFGKGYENWGEKFNHNLLHIMENFKNSTQPAYGDYRLEGQLWFDTSEDPLRKGQEIRQLKLYSKNPNNSDPWEVICNIEDEPLKNIMLKDDLVVLDDYIKISGNTKQMTGQLLVNPVTEDSNDQLYATKKYADNKICKCAYDEVPEYTNLVSSKGDTITRNKVMVPNDFSDSSYAVTKQFVDDYKFFNIEYDKDYSLSSNAVYDVDDIVAYTVKSGKDVMRFISGSFTFPKDETVVTLSWSKPFITDYYMLVSAEMHDYSEYSNDSGKPDDVYGSIVSKTSITINKVSKEFDERVNFLIHGSLINDTPEIPETVINKNVKWEPIGGMVIKVTLPEGFTFNAGANPKIEPSTVTGTSVIEPSNVLTLTLNAGAVTDKEFPVALYLEKSMYSPDDELLNMKFSGTITKGS